MTNRNLRLLAVLLAVPVLVFIGIWGLLAIAGTRLTHLFDGEEPVHRVETMPHATGSMILWGNDTIALLQRVRIQRTPSPYKQFEATFRDSVSAARVVADTTIAAVVTSTGAGNSAGIVVLRIIPRFGYEDRIQRGSVMIVAPGKYLSLY
jgi:hypothetical protein